MAGVNDLKKVEEDIYKAEGYIRHQLGILAALRRDSRDTKLAEAALAIFEETLIGHAERRDHVLKELRLHGPKSPGAPQ